MGKKVRSRGQFVPEQKNPDTMLNAWGPGQKVPQFVPLQVIS